MPLTGTQTAVSSPTIGSVLDTANANNIADALALVKLGTLLGGYDVNFASLTSSATQNITTAAALAKATINSGGVLPDASTVPPGGTLPPILQVISLIDGAGHPNGVAPAAGTLAGTAVAGTGTYAGTVLLSADGTTLTFSAALTAFRIVYIPRPFTSLSSPFSNQNPNPDED
jgi:hypothetical protein